MSKKINIPKYVKKLIHKNPNIVSGRKNFFEHHKRIVKTIDIIKLYFNYKK